MDATVVLVLLFVVAMAVWSAACAVRAHRRGALAHWREELPLLVAELLLAGGAVLWLWLSRDRDVALPWVWLLSLLLAALMPLAVVRPRLAADVLWAVAVATPLVAAVGVTAAYVLADGVTIGTGTAQGWATTVSIGIVGAVVFVSAPTAIAGTLVHDAGAHAPSSSDWLSGPRPHLHVH